MKGCVKGSQATNGYDLHFDNNPNEWNTWEITAGVNGNGDVYIRKWTVRDVAIFFFGGATSRNVHEY